MRILHIDTERGWRGGENQIRLLVEGLHQPSIEHHLAARPASEIIERLTPKTQAQLALPLKGSLDIRSARQIARYCRQHQIDIIDAHTSLAHSLSLWAKRFYPQVALVVHRRVDFRPGKGIFGSLKYQSALVDHYVAISQAIANILVDVGVPIEKISVVRSGIDPAAYLDRDRSGAKHKLAKAFSLDPNLVFIGNASALSHQKDYPTLIRAMRLLKDQGLPVHAFIAGDGEERQSLEKLRMDLGLDHDVTFLGFIQDVPEFLSALDLFTLSSRTEGLGTIVQEAIYSGLPVVATNVGGVPEMIQHEKTGLLVERESPQALAQQLAHLIKSPQIWPTYATAAKQHLAAEFSITSMVDGNRHVYERIVNR